MLIPDPNLRGAVESALDKQPGSEISQAEMAGLGLLDASHSNIEQVEGLQHAVNLRALHLRGNRITDASSLAGLARMQVLDLNGNGLTEIDVTRMTDLRFLDLGNNDLASIDLSGQRTRVGENRRDSQLYALWLHNNRLTSVDLSGLTALQDRPDGAAHPSYVSLRLDRNRLSSVTGLADLPAGAWSLKLEHNRLTSVDLSGADHLHYLHLNNNPITSTADLAGFSSLTDLRRLYLHQTEITSIDLSPFGRLERAFLNDNRLASVDVTGLDSIQRLWLRGNRLTRVTGLADIGDTLISLNLRSNRLASIDLAPLSNLRQLYLSDNALTAVDLGPVPQLDILWLHNGVTAGGSPADPAYRNQITSLAMLPRWVTDLRLAGNPLAEPISLTARAGLRTLYVSGGQIPDLPALAGLTGLTELGLVGMDLGDLGGAGLATLPHLPELRKLDLSDNSIADVAALAGLVQLTELRIDDNFVSDVSPLRSLTALTDLHVAGNLIMDYAPLRHLIVAGLTVHGGDRQRGDSPDGFFWDIEAAGTLHGWNLGRLAADGILDDTECGLDLICPGVALERWVMAVWLARALDGADPEPLDHNRFDDVHPGLQWAAHVERLASLGIVSGCAVDPARFCPRATVTRAQAATLLARAFDLAADEPSAFVDINRQGPHAAGIDALAAAGITMGCDTEPDRFCPDDLVTRGQAATLINRARDLAASG